MPSNNRWEENKQNTIFSSLCAKCITCFWFLPHCIERDLDHFDGYKERHGEGGDNHEEGAEGEEDGADPRALRAGWIRFDYVILDLIRLD